MVYRLYRLNDNGDSTIGVLFKDKDFFCYTLEDEYRSQKVKGETRIPQGIYTIKFREELSPKTITYRQRHDWFTWHLELQNVPNFENVYIHYGNTDEDTDGCILVGDSSSTNVVSAGSIGNSRDAFERLYLDMKKYLDAGQTVVLFIYDNIEK